jgi:hypothetical protein
VKRLSLRFAGLLAAVVALVMMAAAPAGAHPTLGAGAVTGTVTTSGVTLTAQPTSYTFRPIELTGVITDDGFSCAGTFVTSVVTGGSPSEDVIGAVGTVNGFTFAGGAPGGVCSVNGVTNGGGSFVRNLGLIVVNLNVNITICTVILGCHNNPSAPLTVAALIIPTVGDGVTTPITQAAFAGVFALHP